jgi:hypothetical protein
MQGEQTCPECGQSCGAHKAGCYAIDFSDCRNEERADWAQVALDAFAEEVNESDEPTEQLIRDLITDLSHLCDRKGLDMDTLYEIGRGMYSEETNTGLDRDPDCGPKCDLDGEGKEVKAMELAEKVAELKAAIANIDNKASPTEIDIENRNAAVEEIASAEAIIKQLKGDE